MERKNADLWRMVAKMGSASEPAEPRTFFSADYSSTQHLDASSSSGGAVSAFSAVGSAVYVHSRDDTSPAVWIRTRGSAGGLWAYGASEKGGFGVVGASAGGEGVKGEGSTGVIGVGYGSGLGVEGWSQNGYGGRFSGGKAQLMLKPAGAVGKPTSASGQHIKGEIYMDSAGTLFVCTADGTPGKWRKVSTTAA